MVVGNCYLGMTSRALFWTGRCFISENNWFSSVFLCRNHSRMMHMAYNHGCVSATSSFNSERFKKGTRDTSTQATKHFIYHCSLFSCLFKTVPPNDVYFASLSRYFIWKDFAPLKLKSLIFVAIAWICRNNDCFHTGFQNTAIDLTNRSSCPNVNAAVLCSELS